MPQHAAVLALQIVVMAIVRVIWGKKTAEIPARKRLLWYVGFVTVLMIPCAADDVFKNKSLYVPGAIGTIAYLAVSASFLR